jgi:uncharacterized membrane protein YqaE (UPF0057 family)
MFNDGNTKSLLILTYISLIINHPMKRIYLLTLVAIALIYSSCTVEKRHYMSGYHVEWNHKAPKIGGDGNATTETAEAPKATNPAENTEATITETSVTSVSSSENNITYKTEATANNEMPSQVTSNSKAKVAVKTQAIIESNKKEVAPIIMNSTNTNQSVANHESSDTDLALLVILAIIIPPLAVYLKDDSFSTRFWIDLVLTLLFYVPGMIYALLVVLDAI